LNISLLPLDSRPCNTLFPLKLARIAAENLRLPDRGFMDYFTRPAWFPYIDEWLLDSAASGDYFIISLDMLAYGGLIASRKTGGPDALPRLDLIRRMKDLNPALRIFAFGVIMRTSITTIDEKSRRYWELINEYSRLKGLGGDFAAVEKQIPPEVLGSFLAARERNHRLNCGAVDLLNDRVIDCLALVQEDTAPGGIQVVEQEKLRERLDPAVSPEAFIHNGADEAAMVLLGRVLNSEKPPLIHSEFLNPRGEAMTAAYEDRPFIQNIESQIRCCGLALGGADAPLQLLILPPKGDRQWNSHAQFEGAQDYSGAELEDMAERVERRLGAGKTVGLLDAAYANGGHAAFMKKLWDRRLLGAASSGIGAYAGWNTASNSLGTVLAQLSALCRAGAGPNAGENALFTLERYLDDCLYQSAVRPRIEERLSREGINVLNVGAAKAGVEKLIREELEALAPEVQFRFSLPWPRTFEGRIEVQGLRP
jgi:hypothetical protein